MKFICATPKDESEQDANAKSKSSRQRLLSRGHYPGFFSTVLLLCQLVLIVLLVVIIIGVAKSAEPDEPVGKTLAGFTDMFTDTTKKHLRYEEQSAKVFLQQ